jgi:hypothetical protein
MRYIAPQDGGKMDSLAYTDPRYREFYEGHPGLSAWAGTRCIAAFGLIEMCPGRYTAWAYVSRDASKHMLQLVKKLRNLLNVYNYHRVEMCVDVNFKAGHKLAQLLGFECEAPVMRKSSFYATDETLYARIK